MGQDAVQKIGPEDEGSRCLRNVPALYKMHGVTPHNIILFHVLFNDVNC